VSSEQIHFIISNVLEFGDSRECLYNGGMYLLCLGASNKIIGVLLCREMAINLVVVKCFLKQCGSAMYCETFLRCAVASTVVLWCYCDKDFGNDVMCENSPSTKCLLQVSVS